MSGSNHEIEKTVVTTFDQPSGRLTSFFNLYSSQSDALSLNVFRIFWGALLCYEGSTFLEGTHPGKLSYYYVIPRLHFTYFLFEWVRPFSVDVLFYLPYFLIVSGFLISIGLFYRFALLVYQLVFVYLFLLDSAFYLNHYYLIVILNSILLLIPLDNGISLSSYLFREKRRPTIMRGARWLLQAQVGLVYIAAALVKINSDWLRAQPVMRWLVPHHFLVGGIDLPQQHLTAYIIAYGGIVFDLGIVPLLVCHRTRPVACLLLSCFHLTNRMLFNIGVFPWMMLLCTIFFFEDSWPMTLISKRPQLHPPSIPQRGIRRLTFPVIFFFLFSSILLTHQILVPLRSHLYTNSEVAWEEYGMLFSWRMKLFEKACLGRFYVELQNQTFLITPSEHLTGKQWTQLKSRPDMIVEFAHYLARSHTDPPSLILPRVFADIECELNDRPKQPFVTPFYDLINSTLWEWPYEFVVPLMPLSAHYTDDYPWKMNMEHLMRVLLLQESIPLHRFSVPSGRGFGAYQSDYFGFERPSKHDTRNHIERQFRARV